MSRRGRIDEIAVIAPEKVAETPSALTQASAAATALLQQLLLLLQCLGHFFRENLLGNHTNHVYSSDFLLISRDFDHEHLIYGFSCGLECKFYPTVSHSLAHYSLWVWNLLCYLGNMKSHKCSWMRWLWSSHYSHEHFSNGLLCRLKKLSRLHESPQIKCSWVWWLWELIIWWSSLSHQAGSS